MSIPLKNNDIILLSFLKIVKLLGEGTIIVVHASRRVAASDVQRREFGFLSPEVSISLYMETYEGPCV